MSIWSDFFWTPQFITGSFVSGVLASGFTYFNTKASDKRKFEHEDDVLDRKEWREDLTEAQKEERAEKRRQDETLIASAEEFTVTVTEIINASVDYKGAFNTIRDLVNNLQGNDDPAAIDKLDFAEKVAGAQAKIAVPFNRLKLVASNEVIDAATKTTVAVMTLVRMTTEPFARPVAHNAASDELAKFMNVVRKEIGKTEYTSDDAKSAAYSFFDVLQRQTDDYVEVAREEMKAKGFKTTPWDNYERKTPKVPPPVT
jgi:hypothetical protein